MTSKIVTALAFTLTSTFAMADCTAPDAPEIPGGASATMDQMIAGQTSVKSFQAANIEYMSCLEKVFTAAEAEKETAEGEAQEAAAAAHEKAVDAYNSAVSKEEEVAGQFNTAIREYKAANPS